MKWVTRNSVIKYMRLIIQQNHRLQRCQIKHSKVHSLWNCKVKPVVLWLRLIYRYNETDSIHMLRGFASLSSEESYIPLTGNLCDILEYSARGGPVMIMASISLKGKKILNAFRFWKPHCTNDVWDSITSTDGDLLFVTWLPHDRIYHGLLLGSLFASFLNILYVLCMCM